MRHRAGMSNLSFPGQDADVELGAETITLVGRKPGDSGEDGRPVVVPRSEVAAVELTAPSLLAYGRLEITTRAGERHTVQFARGEQEHFENLQAIIRP